MKIAVITNWPKSVNSKRLVAAAKARGHKAVAYDVMKCYVEIEKAKPNVHYNGRELKGIDAIIPRLTPAGTAYGSSIVRQFEMQGIFTSARSLAIVRASDKLRSLQLLAREGIAIPKTAFASQPQNADDLIKLVGGAPLIIKMLEGTQGLGVVMAETKTAARSVIEAFYHLKAQILVQEYIEEAEGTDIRAFVVGGKVVGAMKRQAIEEEFRSNLHLGGKAEPIKLTKDERKLALAAAKRVGLEIAGVDFIQSDRGPLIIEVNSSPGIEGIEEVTGKDTAAEIIKLAEKNAKQKLRKDQIGA